MPNQLFVKFVPYNENTLANLINKTIKFSTVFEFNDFNEYGTMTCFGRDELYKKSDQETIKLINILDNELRVAKFQKKLLQLAKEMRTIGCDKIVENFLRSGKKLEMLLDDENHECVDWLVNQFKEHLLAEKIDKISFVNQFIALFEETLIYFLVGIFCVSDFLVFENDAAQLMFAHYAKKFRRVGTHL